MARARQTKKKTSVRKASKAVAGASAPAARNALKAAGQTQGEASGHERAGICLRLARMCEEAADHMARAQETLTGGQADGDAVIGHLDAALDCLNRLAEEGERHIAEEDRKAKSA